MCLKSKRPSTYGADNELGGIKRHFAGCLGEKALAKHADKYWNGTIGRVDLPDVGEWQVRARTRIDYEMVLHPEDKDDEIFVLAHVITASLPRVRLSGWIYGRDGKKKEFWKNLGNDRPAFFVPHNQLRPMGEFDANAIQEGDSGA